MRLFFPILLLLVSACASSQISTGRHGDLTVVAQNELPAPTDTDLYTAARPYRIGPFDTLTINVFGIEELSKLDIQTDASGRISFPLAGTIEAVGHTPAEVADILRARLVSAHVREPQVTVNLKETVSQVVTIDGEVREPGLYPVIGNMTLMRAIATAKGTTELAETSNVIVFRKVNGEKMAALYNLKAIREGYYSDPDLYPNDVVVVSDSESRRFFRDALGILPALTYVVVALIN